MEGEEKGGERMRERGEIIMNLLGKIFNLYFYHKEGLNSNIKSVGDKLEFPIRRNERDDSFIFKFGQFDALMEFDIVQINCLLLRRSTL